MRSWPGAPRPHAPTKSIGIVSIEQKIFEGTVDRCLHAIEVRPNEGERRHAELKILRQFPEQWGILFRVAASVFRYQAIRALAGLHVVHQKVFMINEAGGFQPAQIFRKQPGHEQREIADMAMHFALSVKGLRLQQHFGFKQHFNDRVERPALLILDLIELLAVGKFDEQIRDVFGDVQIRPTEMFGETFFRQRAEQLTEWMAARNGTSHLDLPGNPCPVNVV